mmetsp:Transcript_54587/g.122807  ORF Transcript_54587/g.122807 Transcript_54587/m.122807 type:complete len:197 (-) Transcript_54587:289-879(-)
MAWVNNNKKNARFNPNRKDDRLLLSEVTSRRERRPRRETEPEVELVSTEPDHVLSMHSETRVDWLQMALMQAGTGKLKAASLYEVIKNPGFGSGDSAARKQLKALLLANLHLFSPKQKRSLEEASKVWGSQAGGAERASGGGSRRTGASRSSSSSSTSSTSGSQDRRRRQAGRRGRSRKKKKEHSSERSRSRGRRS